MRHEGYLGAIGAFIKGAEEEAGRWISSTEVLLDFVSLYYI
jgi:pantothenate kinase